MLFVGIAAASTLGYILPAWIYLTTHDSERLAMRWPSFLKQFGLPLFMVVFGTASFFIGMATVFSSV